MRLEIPRAQHRLLYSVVPEDWHPRFVDCIELDCAACEPYREREREDWWREREDWWRELMIVNVRLKTKEEGVVPTSLNDLARQLHEDARAAGWWDAPAWLEEAPPVVNQWVKQKDLMKKLALVGTEISEAIEELRKDANPLLRYWTNKQGLEFHREEDSKGLKLEGFGSEIADTIIRLFDLAAYCGLDLDRDIREKSMFNRTRGYRHGGKNV